MFKREVSVRIGVRGSGRLVAALAVSAGLASLAAFGAFPAAARHAVRGGQPGAREHRPGPRGGCRSSSITGLTHNETSHRLTLVHARHGITNTWCTRPNPDVPAHLPSNRWKAGDDLFKTEVAVAYSFGHGMEVQFFAQTGPSKGGCGFLTPAPVPYGCEAKLASDAPRHPVFVFTVFPKGRNKNGVNAQGQTGNR